MNVNPKWRWLLAVGAVVLLLVVLLGGALLKKQPEDAPWVTVQGWAIRNFHPVLSLRFDAPRRRAMTVLMVSVTNAVPEHNGESTVPVPIGGVVRMGSARIINPPLTVPAGTSAQCEVDGLDPHFKPVLVSGTGVGRYRLAGTYRLGVLLHVERHGVAGWRHRVERCWRFKRLKPLFGGPGAESVLLYTKPITNAVPRTADTQVR